MSYEIGVGEQASPIRAWGGGRAGIAHTWLKVRKRRIALTGFKSEVRL